MNYWRGYHNAGLSDLLEKAWQGTTPLILCPPHLSKGNFSSLLPAHDPVFFGEWNDAQGLLLKHSILEHAAKAKWKSEKNFNSVALGLFTSGTSLSEPRLVLYSKENILSSLEAIRAVFKEIHVDTIFCYPQPFHTFGLILGYLQAMHYGLKLCVAEGPYGEDAHKKWFANASPSMLTLGAPTHFKDLLSFKKRSGLVPPPSRSAIVGGAPVSPVLWKMLQEELNIEAPSVGYGCSEASPGLAHLPPGMLPAEEGEVGYLLPNIQAKIDSDLGLHFSGPSLCYAMQVEGEIAHPNSLWVKDRLEVSRREGSYVYRGRLDFVLNRGGEKFSLEAIELDLEKEFAFRAVALAVPHARLGEELALLIAESRNVSRTEVMTFLWKKMGRHFSPQNVFFVKSLPLLPSGKIDRKTAKNCYEEQLLRRLDEKISVCEVQEVLPHRSSAVWISRVDWITEDEGQAYVEFAAKDGNAFDQQNAPRQSSYIEWMAQATGYISGLRSIRILRDEKAAAKKAFLAGVKNIRFHAKMSPSAQGCFVRVRQTHQLGPISLIRGEVLSDSHELICSGELRLYVERAD